MEAFVGSTVLVTLILAFILMFTREKNNKLDYLKRVGAIFFIGMGAAMLAFPLYGPIFGSTAIFLNSVILGTLLEFK